MNYEKSESITTDIEECFELMRRIYSPEELDVKNACIKDILRKAGRLAGSKKTLKMRKEFLGKIIFILDREIDLFNAMTVLSIEKEDEVSYEIYEKLQKISESIKEKLGFVISWNMHTINEIHNLRRSIIQSGCNTVIKSRHQERVKRSQLKRKKKRKFSDQDRYDAIGYLYNFAGSLEILDEDIPIIFEKFERLVELDHGPHIKQVAHLFGRLMQRFGKMGNVEMVKKLWKICPCEILVNECWGDLFLTAGKCSDNALLKEMWEDSPKLILKEEEYRKAIKAAGTCGDKELLHLFWKEYQEKFDLEIVWKTVFVAARECKDGVLIQSLLEMIPQESLTRPIILSLLVMAGEWRDKDLLITIWEKIAEALKDEATCKAFLISAGHCGGEEMVESVSNNYGIDVTLFEELSTEEIPQEK